MNSQETMAVADSAYPAVVHLGTYSCAGTLIGVQHILTAAHCFNGDHKGLPICPNIPNGGNCKLDLEPPEKRLLVTVNGVQNVVTHIFKNTCFIYAKNEPQDADLAILQLQVPIDNVAVIPRYTGHDEVGKKFTLVGWGDIGMAGGQPSSSVLMGQLFAGENAFEAAVGNTLVSKLDDPAGVASKALDKEAIGWYRDGGGPALMTVDGTVYLVGVSTGGNGTLVNYGDKGTYVRVSSAKTKAWIDSTIANGGSADPGVCADWQAFDEACPYVSVIRDVALDPWYSECVGLKAVAKPNLDAAGNEVPWTELACEEICNKDMKCGLWQLVSVPPDNKVKCWTGKVTRWDECDKNVTAGKLIQHGYIDIITVSNHTQTLGLNKLPTKTGEIQERVDHCRNVCYSDVTCTVWQFGEDGCWVEQLPGYPRGKTVKDSDWAKGFVAGEIIGHTCNPPVDPEGEEEEGTPWAWIIGGSALGALVIGGLAYLGLSAKSARKTKMKQLPEDSDGSVYEDSDVEESLE